MVNRGVKCDRVIGTASVSLPVVGKFEYKLSLLKHHHEETGAWIRFIVTHYSDLTSA